MWIMRKRIVNCYRMVGFVPISNKDSVITIRIRKRDWNSGPTEYPNATKTTSCFVKWKRWKIVKASNLILHLKYVSKVPPWWDGACCSKNTIFEWVSSLLYTIPAPISIPNFNLTSTYYQSYLFNTTRLQLNPTFLELYIFF